MPTVDVMRRLSQPERARARERLESFVLRARRVMAHSLVRDHMDLLREVVNGTVKVRVTKDPDTGERQQSLLMELPPEEAFESFASRLRPFTMRDEPVYWANVFDAIEDLTPQQVCDEVIDIGSLRTAFSGVTEGKNDAQAYYVITNNGQLTDLQIADLWLYSDALHARKITSAVGLDLGLDERYQAAAGVYARLGGVVSTTYAVIRYLFQEQLIELDESVFTDRVVAETSIDRPIAGGYTSAVGTPIPDDLSTNLDPDVWRPMWEEMEDIIASSKQQEDEDEAANPCSMCRGTGGVRIRWPDGKMTTARWINQAE